jgi:hypothetical protein
MTLTVALYLLIACVSFGRVYEFWNGDSPNGRFGVRVFERRQGAELSYEIFERRNGAVLHRFASSFQPDGESGDWDWKHAIDAEVSWSADSRYVVIDEQTHRYMGKTLIAEIGARNRSILIPERAIIKRIGLPWDRYRIRVRGGWFSSDRLSLVVAGQVIQGTLDDGRLRYERLKVHFVLWLLNGRAVIVRLDPAEKSE